MQLARARQVSWRRLAQAVVLLLALGFLALLVRGQWASLTSHTWRLTPSWGVLALAGLELTWLYEVDVWRSILRGLGGTLPYHRAARAWFLSNILRYIPGNIWQYLGMAELAAQDGVPRLVTLTSIVLHQVLSIAAGLALAAAYFAAFSGTGAAHRLGGDWLPRLRPLLWLVPLGLLLLQPRLLERFLNWALARLHRPAVQVTLTWRQIWLLLLRYLLVWLAMGLSFAALVRAITPVSWAEVPYLIATWAAAYVAGFLSLLTPSGLGVREGVMVLLLAAIVPVPVAAVIAIVARIWMVVGELLGAGGIVLFERWPTRRP